LHRAHHATHSFPTRRSSDLTDEPDDAGDALQFIERLEVNVGGGRCSAVGATEDTDDDGYPDAFPAILPGTPVCWDVVVADNTTVDRKSTRLNSSHVKISYAV